MDRLFKVEAVLLTATRLTTRLNGGTVSNATGFFFERDERLFLITNRHVVLNEPSNHRPDALDLKLHVSETNLVETVSFLVPLYPQGAPCWLEASDASGVVDVVAIELNRTQLPKSFIYRAFTPQHLVEELDEIEVGTPLLVIGFPLGFLDNLHHLPVARQAIIASAFGFRFQGTGCFLTDGRTHRGISGAPVVTRFSDRRGRAHLPYTLLGIHASRIDVGTRDQSQDEALGLNMAWYSDVLLTLTEPAPVSAPPVTSPPVTSSPATAPSATQQPTEKKAQLSTSAG
ncbi:MAG: trypsin-like peptidase domain-containing protein [Planctomycetaceae bacterium]